MAALVVIISGYAAYGLIDFSLRQSQTFVGRSYATSTFVNHNHFGAYVGVGLVITLGLLLKLYQRHVDEYVSVRQSVAAFFETSAQQSAVMLTSAFVLTVALLVSGSRGAVVATTSGVIALAILCFGRRSNAKQRILVLVGAGTMAAVVLFFGDNLLGQIAQKGISDENRLAVYMITLRSILDAPLWGYGYGTFADVFPMFRDRSLSVFGIWEQAHNTYLEVYQGLGLIFGSCLILALAMLSAKCCQGATQRQDNMIPAIAASVAVLLAIHSMVDFSLQIQAMTLTYAAVLGAGVAQSWGSRVALYGA
jgi:O-antigen ligase